MCSNGTSLPEIIVSVAASLHGQLDLPSAALPVLPHHQYFADLRLAAIRPFTAFWMFYVANCH
ncbi:hypothetical protein KCP74_08670 [Salmonella enterica subsp. enterica]|nr:hypothetical protein KCP74_08670 [Salmonella enterica subsp. enterica]